MTKLSLVSKVKFSFEFDTKENCIETEFTLCPTAIFNAQGDVCGQGEMCVCVCENTILI